MYPKIKVICYFKLLIKLCHFSSWFFTFFYCPPNILITKFIKQNFNICLIFVTGLRHFFRICWTAELFHVYVDSNRSILLVRKQRHAEGLNINNY